MKNYDLAIIGSGPGGYVAGLYASGLKLSVCIIEKGLVGGTCLNRGCIPTKALLNSASIISTIKDSSLHGIEVGTPKVNFPKVMLRKNEVVSRLHAGIETLFRARKVDLIRGQAKLISSGTIIIDDKEGIAAKSIIIASGSTPAELPNMKFDGLNILSSDTVLDIKELPGSITVIGGGVIGCEFASMFNAFGTKVTIIELMDRLISVQSREASKRIESIFKKRGMDIYTSTKIESVSIESEKVLVSVGRRPSTDGLGLEELKIKTEKSRIVVDDGLRTSVKNIYAIGDCVSGPQLAHKASYDGILAVDNILGGSRVRDYSNIPNCIWTEPEIASVGLTEEEAKVKYQDLHIAKFPYLASGKAFILGKNEGFAKVIGSSKGDIIGVEIFGVGACELIAEAVMARTIGLNIKDWAHVVHGHPTLSEILQEAARIFCGTPIHSI